jgi:hypothetical protein
MATKANQNLVGREITIVGMPVPESARDLKGVKDGRFAPPLLEPRLGHTGEIVAAQPVPQDPGNWSLTVLFSDGAVLGFSLQTASEYIRIGHLPEEWEEV